MSCSCPSERRPNLGLGCGNSVSPADSLAKNYLRSLATPIDKSPDGKRERAAFVKRYSSICSALRRRALKQASQPSALLTSSPESAALELASSRQAADAFLRQSGTIRADHLSCEFR